MKYIIFLGAVCLVALGGYFVYSTNVTDIHEEVLEVQAELAAEVKQDEAAKDSSLEYLPSITPISHASMVMTWHGTTLYTDPVGPVDQYADMMAPHLVLLTDIHGDHLNAETLEGVIAGDTVIIAPQAVYDLLPENLALQAVVMANGDTITQQGISITAVPMYNVPETDDSRHTKGRGNGYLLERVGVRVYIAGDTGGTPEMRALTDIDMAFIPMNLPYTMSVDEAAEAVLAFAPKTVIPYHYRGPDGLSDVERFKSLIEANSTATKVLLLNWYSGVSEVEEEEDLETE